MIKKLPVLSFLAAALVSVGCSSSPPSGAGTPPASGAALTPTPGILARLNPNVVEETETYVIERIPKEKVIRVDDRHIRLPIIPSPIQFFKEDENYYYVQTFKRPSAEEVALLEEEEKRKASAAASVTPAPSPSGEAPASSPPPAETVSLADFADLFPPRVPGGLKLAEVSSSGLPKKGMWRASFVVADMNRDGIPDIVSPPSRIGGTLPQVWKGNGQGSFSEWPLTFLEGGKPVRLSIAYGGIAAGDIDGDGHLDLATASHGGGLTSLFGDGTGRFEIVRQGLPVRDFSSQAVTLADADGDGKLDLVASRDIVGSEEGTGGVDKRQVRLYLFRGREKGWEFAPDAIVGGFYSNTLRSFDYDADGKDDILTGSHYLGALSLLWRNEGNASFSPVSFPQIEIYSYHFAAAPGTFGKERVPAFADAYNIITNLPETARAVGISVYSYRDGAWSRHRVWRKKNGESLLNAVAFGDLDGDGMDDVVFADSEQRRLRVFFQRTGGSFVEQNRDEEPILDSPGQCVRLADLNGDGRLDVVLAKTVSSAAPGDPGGWSVYLNRR